MADPKYIEIADDVGARIRRGEWEPGEQLPGQAEFAEEQRVGVQTVSRAFEILQRQGLIETRSREGTFVAQAHVHATSTRHWYERPPAEKFGGARETWETVEAGRADPDEVPEDVRRDLELDADEGAGWRVRRLLDAGEVTQWHRAWRPGGLLDEVPELADPSPIPDGDEKLIYKRTGRWHARGRDRLRARGASAEDAEMLDISRGHPVLELWHRAWDQERAPLLVEITVYPAMFWSGQDPYDLDRPEWLEE